MKIGVRAGLESRQLEAGWLFFQFIHSFLTLCNELSWLSHRPSPKRAYCLDEMAHLLWAEGVSEQILQSAMKWWGGSNTLLGTGRWGWGWGWGLGRSGKEILLQHHRKDPTSGPSRLLTNHPAPPNQPNKKCELFYAELNEQENKKACTQRITAAVSQIPWNMMPRKIKYLLLIKLREIYQKHSLVSGNLAFLSKHWT